MTLRLLGDVAAAVDSDREELQDLLGSASLVSGNLGPSHGFLARMFGLRQMRHHRSSGVSSYHVGHLWWPSPRTFWRFGGLNVVGRAQIAYGTRVAVVSAFPTVTKQFNYRTVHPHLHRISIDPTPSRAGIPSFFFFLCKSYQSPTTLGGALRTIKLSVRKL
jgi:hypothetical protein